MRRIALLLALTMTALAATPPSPPAKETTQDQRMKWFREAKFGLFIHWGLYSIPAGEWKGKAIPGIGEWIMNRAKIPVDGIRATRHAVQSREVRRRGVGADGRGRRDEVHRHHQQASRRLCDVSFAGQQVQHRTMPRPFHRDPLKELAAACKRHHIRFGFYYSQAQDWHEPNGAGNTWDFGPDDEEGLRPVPARARPSRR